MIKAIDDNGRLQAVSPSQISTFKSCQRKWYYEKVLKIPKKPMARGALQGQHSHKILEDFLLTGKDLRTPLELSGQPLLAPYLDTAPFNGGLARVEASLIDPTLTTELGIVFQGRIDLLVPREKEVIVIDHKFKKDVVMWGVSDEELRDDPQAIIYGAWAFSAFTEATEYEFQHHSYQTQRFYVARQTVARFTRDELFAKFNVIKNLVDFDMVNCANSMGVENTSVNTKFCSAYGGCDYANICSKSVL